MSEMEKRVARAIFSAVIVGEDEAKLAARAAIEAMREPTGRMVRAAAKSMSPDARPTPEWVPSQEKHRIRYRAMIDAALATGPESAQSDGTMPAKESAQPELTG